LMTLYLLLLSPLFFLMILPRQWSTLFPYTTLFRSSRPSTPAALAMLPISLAKVTLVACQTLQLYLIISATAMSLRTMGASSSRRSEEHTSELQSRENLVCRLLLEKKKNKIVNTISS